MARDLAALVAQDPRLVPVAERTGPLPLRLAEPGLFGLLRIVSGQQLSTQSALAVWTRFAATFDETPATILAAREEALRAVGLSRQKVATFRAVAAAVEEGLDLCAMARLPAEEGRRALTALPGVGRWTADVYLMFCGGHPDILPSGDLAVRKGLGFALNLSEAPTMKAVDELGERWSPYRSTAARLFWANYRVVGQKKAGEGLPP